VETADAVLVAPIDRSQDVKKIVDRLKRDKRPEYHTHRTVHRPWGSYTTLEMQDRFQIKRITVHPGARLSLQMHHHRHEHWVVVSGTAKVQNGEQSNLLKENESTYIPSVRSTAWKTRSDSPGTDRGADRQLLVRMTLSALTRIRTIAAVENSAAEQRRRPIRPRPLLRQNHLWRAPCWHERRSRIHEDALVGIGEVEEFDTQ
jgi:mannose-6-phosphate isomerase-like protein (cupin superfamily)